MTTKLRTRSALDVSAEALDGISAQATKLVAEYFTNVAERDVLAPNHAGKTSARVNARLEADGVPLERLMEECQTIIDLSRHNGHPRFFGYVASPSTPIQCCSVVSPMRSSVARASSPIWQMRLAKS